MVRIVRAIAAVSPLLAATFTTSTASASDAGVHIDESIVAIEEGRIDAASSILTSLSSETLTTGEREMVAELTYFVDAAPARGRLPFPVDDDAEPSDVPALARRDFRTWDGAFARARGKLVRGWYRASAIDYARLRDLAPDDGRRKLSEMMRALADTLHARPRTIWYGGTVLIVDGIALLTTIIGVGALVYPFGGPLVHLRHGRPAVAALDFGVRVAAPFAGVGLFIALGGRTSGGRSEFLSVPSAGAIASGILPCLGAMIFDASVLAYEPARGPSPFALPSFMPFVTARAEGGADAVIAGSF